MPVIKILPHAEYCPNGAEITAPAGTSIQNQLACTVESIRPDSHPSQVLVRLRCGTATLLARVTARSAAKLELAADRAVWALVKSVALVE